MQVASMNRPTDHDFARLVSATQQGDRAAFEDLVAATHLMLRKIALPLVPSSAVEDVLQESYITMFQKIHYLREPRAFRSWLSRIALNACYDIRRKTPLAESLAEQPEQAGEFQEPVDVLALRKALGKLKRKDRNILILREYLDASYEEIGDILDLASGTVKSRLFYARKKLQEIMQKQDA